jgi:hypothetical protein
MCDIERKLRDLIERHTIKDGGYYKIAVPEIANILEPGSMPMYPGDYGHAPTCEICAPNGDGFSVPPWLVHPRKV